MRIELRDICHKLEQRQLLENINLTVESGQCLVVSGRSGSGKSLLFSIVCGIFPPQRGEVLVDGQSIVQMSEAQNLEFRKHLGVIFQVSALISNLTLAENLMLPLNLYFPDRNCDEKRQEVQAICHEFGLESYLDQRTDQLSTGLAALAGLARALLVEPKLLVWDAPMSEIDLKWNDHLNNRLKHLKNAGTTFILFTNRQRIIERLADVRLDLSEGNSHAT
ncbi:MAG: ATP-binding cassette domain-containing protein [Algicola sp.]|nr:ATP-binding cassette domain-containing protein [Algicola sp.]